MRILKPDQREAISKGQQMKDPLGEELHSPHPRIIHRYSDRVVFLVTDVCSVYCRYCTRKRFTGNDEAMSSGEEYAGALDYLRNHTSIREVILSGGDPLTLSDSHLFRVMRDLRAISHIEVIRLGTRMPVVCPMRITTDLVKGLREFKPVFLMTHFNHPAELTEEASIALELFVDHGVPVFNQMVLLNGINNHESIVQALSRRLLYLRVKPYYMFQCDPSEGTEHFRTSVKDSLRIQKALWGHLSGLAMPQLSLDIPGGGGKVSLVPNFLMEASDKSLKFKGWDGKEGAYHEPEDLTFSPPDIDLYKKEWETLCGIKSSPSDGEILSGENGPQELELL